MHRIDLELYADRLAQHALRLSDDLSAARLRIAWGALEADARPALGARRAALLEAVGVLGCGRDPGDVALIERRQAQLDALSHLQAWVEERIHGAASHGEQPAGPAPA